MLTGKGAARFLRAFAAGGPYWLSLHVGDPGNGGIAEVRGGGYGRLQVKWAPVDEESPELVNADGLLFEDLPAVRATHVGLWTSQRAGDLLHHQPLEVAKKFDAGDALELLPGKFRVKVTT